MTLVTQRRPTGASWPTTAAWKAGVERDMAEMGMTPSELARRCNTTRQAIGAMLGPASKSSKLVPKVHAALGRRSPVAPGEASQLTSTIIENWEEMTEEQRETIRRVARGFRSGT